MLRCCLGLLWAVAAFGLAGPLEINFAATSGKVGTYFGDMGVKNGIGLFGIGGYFARGNNNNLLARHH